MYVVRTCTSYMRIVSTHAENNAHVRRADYSKHVRHTRTAYMYAVLHDVHGMAYMYTVHANTV